MTPGTTVATANVLYTLGPADARRALGDVLARRPDLVGLQEWYPSRFRLLRETGRVRPVPFIGAGPGRRSRRRMGDYLWNLPLVGGCVVGARADRYDLLSCRARLLTGPGRADREDRFLGLEPP